MNQEVLLEFQLPVPTCAVDQHHTKRDFLVCLVYMVQKRQGAVEGYFYLTFTQLSTSYYHV